MIEEIAHLIFGPAGAVAAIVMLDSIGSKQKNSNEVARRSKQPMPKVPIIVSAPQEESDDIEIDDDNAEKATAKTLKKAKTAKAKESARASKGRAPRRIVSAEKKAKSKTSKQATVPARRSKTAASKKARKAA